jgi:hypothetical protein
VLAFPRPETFIVVQVAAIAAAALVLYQFARGCGLGERPAQLLALAFLISPSAHGRAYMDFSENVFVPLVAFSLALAVQRRSLPATLLLAQLLMGVKEDQIWFLAWFGLAGALWYDRRLGLSVLALAIMNGIAYYALVRHAGFAPVHPRYSLHVRYWFQDTAFLADAVCLCSARAGLALTLGGTPGCRNHDGSRVELSHGARRYALHRAARDAHGHRCRDRNGAQAQTRYLRRGLLLRHGAVFQRHRAALRAPSVPARSGRLRASPRRRPLRAALRLHDQSPGSVRCRLAQPERPSCAGPRSPCRAGLEHAVARCKAAPRRPIPVRESVAAAYRRIGLVSSASRYPSAVLFPPRSSTMRFPDVMMMVDDGVERAVFYVLAYEKCLVEHRKKQVIQSCVMGVRKICIRSVGKSAEEFEFGRVVENPGKAAP